MIITEIIILYCDFGYDYCRSAEKLLFIFDDLKDWNVCSCNKVDEKSRVPDTLNWSNKYFWKRRSNKFEFVSSKEFNFPSIRSIFPLNQVLKELRKMNFLFAAIVAVVAISGSGSAAPAPGDLADKYPSFSVADILDKKGFNWNLVQFYCNLVSFLSLFLCLVMVLFFARQSSWN